jgi:hypothetical protein
MITYSLRIKVTTEKCLRSISLWGQKVDLFLAINWRETRWKLHNNYKKNLQTRDYICPCIIIYWIWNHNLVITSGHIIFWHYIRRHINQSDHSVDINSSLRDFILLYHLALCEPTVPSYSKSSRHRIWHEFMCPHTFIMSKESIFLNAVSHSSFFPTHMLNSKWCLVLNTLWSISKSTIDLQR